jgi:Sec-independent protein translocase protein TatA
MEMMHLIGAEQVERAGHSMASAAEAMQRAASSMESTAERLIRAMDEAAMRMERAAEQLAASLVQGTEATAGGGATPGVIAPGAGQQG